MLQETSRYGRGCNNTIQEITGVVTLQDSSNSKKYLPSWISKNDPWKEYRSKCWYQVSFINQGVPFSVWVCNGDKSSHSFVWTSPEILEAIYCNIVASIPQWYIWTLCHALGNQCHHNLSWDLLFLFCKDTGINEGCKFDHSIVYNWWIIPKLIGIWRMNQRMIHLRYNIHHLIMSLLHQLRSNIRIDDSHKRMTCE